MALQKHASSIIALQQAVIMFLLGCWGMNTHPDETFLIPTTFAAAALSAIMAVRAFFNAVRG